MAVLEDNTIIFPIFPLLPLYLLRIRTCAPTRKDGGEEMDFACVEGSFGAEFLCERRSFSAVASCKLILKLSKLDLSSSIWASKAASDNSGVFEVCLIPYQ